MGEPPMPPGGDGVDPSSVKEIGSFAALVVPVMAAFIWGGKMLLNWFTTQLAKEQDAKDRLMTELVTVMRETQTAHVQMVNTLGEIAKELSSARVASAKEHEAIIECLNRKVA
jgi:hypothetical protein